MSVGLLACDSGALIAGATFNRQPGAWDMLFAVLVIAAFHAKGLYRTRLTLSVLDDMPRLVGVVAVAAIGALAAATAWGFSAGIQATVLSALLSVALVITARTGAYAAIRRVRTEGWFAHRAVILGTGPVGARLGDALREHPEYGLRLVGFVGGRPRHAAGLPAPVIAPTDKLADVVGRRGIAVVVVAFGGVRMRDVVAALRAGAVTNCQVFVVPRLFEVHGCRQLDWIRSTPLFRLPRPASRGVWWGAKRAFDVVVSGLAVAILCPLLLVVAAAVWIESGPPVLFRQQRVGLGGREFTIYKFRSITPVDDEESHTRWTVARDAGMGPVGRFIRRTSLDELPQLFNVLRGDMSLVGPRPERPYFVRKFSGAITSYGARHRVPVGLTGWAAVNNLRGDTSITERAHFDNFYIDNWSLWLDLKILLLTLPALLRGHDG